MCVLLGKEGILDTCATVIFFNENLIGRLQNIVFVRRQESIKVERNSLSIYLFRLGCSLGDIPLFSLKNLIRPSTWETKLITSNRKDIEVCNLI